MCPLALRYSNAFWNAKVKNEGELADFANFTPKIGCHGNVPYRTRKEGLIDNL